jgi:hypothetical protein
MDSWFVTGETRRLALPGGHWIEVKECLTWGEQRQLETAAIRAQVALERGEPSLVIDLKRHAVMRLLLYLVDWSLTLPDGRPAPIDEETLEKLHPTKAQLLQEALDRHVAEMEAAVREALSPSPSPSPAPASAPGVGGAAIGAGDATVTSFPGPGPGSGSGPVPGTGAVPGPGHGPGW